MASNNETFIIGGREFTCTRMNAFDANKFLLRLQKVVMPIVGKMIGDADVQKALDMDIKEIASAFSELDESVITNVIFPILEQSRAVVNVDGDLKPIKNESTMNLAFTSEQLMDFYELVWLVIKFQFTPFFNSLTSRFGNQTAKTPIQ